MELTLRPLTLADVPALGRLEAELYLPSLHESEEAFSRLITLFPDGCLGAFDGEGLCGYGLAVPMPAGATLALKAPLTAIPRDADALYIHDVAVAPRWRRRGVAARLVAALLAAGERNGLRRADLVAVQAAEPFWERMGFVRVEAFEYAPGAPATKMTLGRPRRMDGPAR